MQRGEGLHEQFAREYSVAGSSDRQFGIVIGGLLILIAGVRGVLSWQVDSTSSLLALFGIGLVVTAFVAPRRLARANQIWMRFGLLLHRVTNPLLLGAIFVLAIVPTGLIMRTLGADPMRRRKRHGASHWIDRTTRGSTSQSLQQPF